MRSDDCYSSSRACLSIYRGILLDVYMQGLFLAIRRGRWVLPDVLAWQSVGLYIKVLVHLDA